MNNPQKKNIRDQSIWALGNIAGDSPQYRNLVLQANVMEPLLCLIYSTLDNMLDEKTNLSLLRNATWTLSNLCRGKPRPPFETVSPALTVLNKLIKLKDPEILADTCWTLSYLCDGPNENIAAVIESGVTERCVELLMHPETKVKVPALRTVGNLVTSFDEHTQKVIAFKNCLPNLLALLYHQKKEVRKEAAWTISNITAGNKDQINLVLQATGKINGSVDGNRIVPKLIDLLKHDCFDVKKEAAWALSNCTSGGTNQQIFHLVSQGAIPQLCDLLCKDIETKIIVVALEGLTNILKVGNALSFPNGMNPCSKILEHAGGLEKLYTLQEHEDVGVYEKSLKILEQYFDFSSSSDKIKTTAAAITTATTIQKTRCLQLLEYFLFNNYFKADSYNHTSARFGKLPFCLVPREKTTIQFKFVQSPTESIMEWQRCGLDLSRSDLIFQIEKGAKVKLHNYLGIIKKVIPKMYGHYGFRQLFCEYLLGTELCKLCELKFVKRIKNINDNVNNDNDRRITNERRKIVNSISTPYICSYKGTINKNHCYIKNKSRPILV